MQAGAQTTRQPALPGLPPQQTNHRMQLLGSFDDTPAVVTCANCGVTGHTFVYKVSCQRPGSHAELKLLSAVIACLLHSVWTYAGEWVLCILQRNLMPSARLLAMHVDAILREALQRFSTQVQQLRSCPWKACIRQVESGMLVSLLSMSMVSSVALRFIDCVGSVKYSPTSVIFFGLVRSRWFLGCYR